MDENQSFQLQGQEIQQISQKPSPTAIEDLKNSLKSLLTAPFVSNDPLQQEPQYTLLIKTLNDLKKQNLYNVFDSAFFQKLLILSQMNNPLKCKRLAELYMGMIQKSCNSYSVNKTSKGIKICNFLIRLIIDLLNGFFNLMEKFSGTIIEWNLKILFEEINLEMAQQPFYFELLGHVDQFGDQIGGQIQVYGEQQKMVEKIAQLSKFDELNKKNEAITLVSIVLGKCGNFEQQFYMFTSILTPIFTDLVELPKNVSEQAKSSFYNALLDILDRYIFQTEYQIIIDKTHVHETRQYTLKNEKAYLMNHPQIYYSVGTILNKVLLLPQEINLNCRAFQIIRRLYYLFPNQRKLFEGPICVVLSNIALFSKELNQEKDPTIFLYKLLKNEDTSQDLKDKLDQNEYLQRLKENKYYSIKALSYSNDIDTVYKFRNFYLSILSPFYKKIDAGGFFHFNILVQKPNTIVYWNFKTIDYDIQFGFYKVESLDELLIQDYLQEKHVKPIIKLQKSECYKQQITGFSLLNMPGFYRVVFDNSYSFWRVKELFYQILVLET